MKEFDKQCEIITFFDDCRWLQPENYGLINFHDKYFDNNKLIWRKLDKSVIKDTKEKDAILLTHLFCYIVDRQMPYRRIWDVSGYIFSKMVNDYIFSEMNVNDIINKYVVAIKEKNKKNEISSYIFICDRKGDKEKNKRLEKYNANFQKIAKEFEIVPINKENEKYINNYKDDCVFFKSRFYNIDIFSIKRTLEILEDYERSLTKYLSRFIVKTNSAENMINSMACALDLLSYNGIENVKINEKEYYSKLQEEIKLNIKNNDKPAKIYIGDLLNKQEKDFLNDIKLIFNNKRKFSSKRLWCTLRDFLKSKQYNTIFKENIEKNIEKNKLDKLFKYRKKDENEIYDAEAKKYLQLPGDVWNNNDLFRECLADVDKTKLLAKELDKILKDKNITYPEQFDITFDFVPRMCEQNNCDICPFDFLKNKSKKSENKILDLCFKESDDNKSILQEKLCPIALVCCGYKVICAKMCVVNGENNQCKLRDILIKN